MKKQHYTWNQFDRDMVSMAQKIKAKRKNFDGVWGPARGGLPIAVVLSHKLGIPLLSHPKSTKTLIVDDIADTGRTLKKLSCKNFIATIFYHKQSVFEPDLWFREKKSRWIVFPWEQ